MVPWRKNSMCKLEQCENAWPDQDIICIPHYYIYIPKISASGYVPNIPNARVWTAFIAMQRS